MAETGLLNGWRKHWMFRKAGVSYRQLKYQDAVEEGRNEGRAEGRAEGQLEGKLEIARKLLKRNRPIDEIVEDTGLTHKDVETLLSEA